MELRFHQNVKTLFFVNETVKKMVGQVTNSKNIFAKIYLTKNFHLEQE